MIEQYVLKNGKKHYEVNHYLGLNPRTGEEIRARKKGFETRNEAKLFISRKEIEFKNNQGYLKPTPTRQKFEDVYRQWFKQYKLTVKENTYVLLKKVTDLKILPLLKKYYIDMISVEMCQDLANKWYSSFTKATMLVSVVNRIFKFAINAGYCLDNPMSKIIRPKNTHKKAYEAPFYSKNELLHFLDCVRMTENNMKIVMFRVLAFTGLRRGEILGLKWKDIDEVNQTLTVRRVLAQGEHGTIFQSPKTKASHRTISIDNITMDLLVNWRNIQRKDLLSFGINANGPEQLVFTNQKNNPLNLYYIGTALQRITKLHKLKHINVHGFRHTHCALLFEAKLEMKEVQERLGHANIETTMNIYDHVTQNRRDEAAEKFAQFMSF